MDIELTHTAKTDNQLNVMTSHELSFHLKSLIQSLHQHTAEIVANDNLDAQILLEYAQALVGSANELSIVATKFTDEIDKKVAHEKISAAIRLHSGPFIIKDRDN